MSKAQDDLFFLLRLALCGKEDNSADVKSLEWKEIFELAKDQCVMGIVADSFQLLDDIQAQGLNKLQWLGNVLLLERKNAELNKLVGMLFGKFHHMGLSPVLMKGQAFASNYPNPHHRQCGDIDIYFKGRTECEGAVLWAEKIDKASAESSDNKRERKHFTFSVGGNVVELHYFMCLFENGDLQHRLQKIIDEEFAHAEPFFVGIEGKQIETVPPTLSVLHQVLHITRHLLEAGIGLRQICDLAVYLRKNHNVIDAVRLNGYLVELQLMKTAKVLGYIMAEYLGLPKEVIPFEIDEQYADFILQEIFEGGNFGKKKVVYRHYKNGIQRKIYSIVYFYHRCQLYKPLLPMEAKSYFWNKIKLNIKLIFVRHY